jgi:integrase
LRTVLDAYKGSLLLAEGRIFNLGDLDKVALRIVKPAAKVAGIRWSGWHGFRRGLATTLHDLGIDLLVIQQILRHGDPDVTQLVT